MDAAGGLLDVSDHLRQLLGGAVGIVAHAGEHALKIAVHACTQIALGQRAEQARDLGDAACIGIEQGVELLRQLQEEALLADAVDALGQVACGRAAYHVGHGDFDLRFGAAVAPFADKSQVCAGRVADRRDILHDAGGAILHFALRRALAVQALIDFRVLRVAHFQLRHRLADQWCSAVEGGCAGVDVVGVGVQQGLQRVVGVDDGQIRIGDVHAGRGVVERGADAQVFGGDAALALQSFAQIALHARQCRHQTACVFGGDRNRLIQAALGDMLCGGHGQLRFAAEQAEHRAQNPASRQRQTHEREPHRAALLPHHPMAVLLGLAAIGRVQGQDALADRAHAGFELAEFVVEIGVGRAAVGMRFGQRHHLIGRGDVGLQGRRHRFQLAAQCRVERQRAVGLQRLAKFCGVFAQRGACGGNGGIVLPGCGKQRGSDIAAQGVMHHVRLHVVAQCIGRDHLRGDRRKQAALAVVADAAQGEQRQRSHQYQNAQHVHDFHCAACFRSGKTDPRRVRDPVSAG